jgi:hypothetical protein
MALKDFPAALRSAPTTVRYFLLTLKNTPTTLQDLPLVLKDFTTALQGAPMTLHYIPLTLKNIPTALRNVPMTLQAFSDGIAKRSDNIALYYVDIEKHFDSIE